MCKITMPIKYDCLVVGGGVNGMALLYVLARFTELRRLCLVEMHDRAGSGTSDVERNSQTIHYGDIETHLEPGRSSAARYAASMLMRYVDGLLPQERGRIVHRMPRMLLGIGSEECRVVRDRYRRLAPEYPDVKLMGRQAIAEIEPNVALVKGDWRSDEIIAIGKSDDDCGVNFSALAESFARACSHIDRETNKQIDQKYSTRINRIRRSGRDYLLETEQGASLLARSLVLCAGAHSLSLVEHLGLGLDYACLPIEGRFLFTPAVLNGKVYRVHDPRVPFVAMHGDRDIRDPHRTRFGPIASLSSSTVLGLHDRSQGCLKPLTHASLTASLLWKMAKQPELRHYMGRNLLYAVPILNRRRLLVELRKIVPSLALADFHEANIPGGIRPLILKKDSGHRAEQTNIVNGEGCIVNLAPALGGTGCLRQAEQDMRMITQHLGGRVDERKLKQELLP